jgi:hypothetical protein
MDNVFVIRPRMETSMPAHLPPSKWCDCIDRISKHPNPDCMACGGTGVIEYPEDVEVTMVDGSQRLSKAEIIFENALTLYNDEDDEEIPITDIMAYFDKNEDVRSGDIIQHKGKKYQVVQTKKVSSIKNQLYLLCYLDRVSQ